MNLLTLRFTICGIILTVLAAASHGGAADPKLVEALQVRVNRVQGAPMSLIGNREEATPVQADGPQGERRSQSTQEKQEGVHYNRNLAAPQGQPPADDTPAWKKILDRLYQLYFPSAY